jgi:hypothetical protein
MEVHRSLGDMRLERVLRVGQGGQFESHGDLSGVMVSVEFCGD